MYPTHLWTMSIFSLYPPEDNRKSTSGFLGFLLRKCWVGAFPRNGSITNTVNGMQGFLWLASLDNTNRSSGFLRMHVDFVRVSAVEILTFYALSTCK